MNKDANQKSLRGLQPGSFSQRSPTFLAPGTVFMEDSFSTDQRWGWFRDDPSALHSSSPSCAARFLTCHKPVGVPLLHLAQWRQGVYSRQLTPCLKRRLRPQKLRPCPCTTRGATVGAQDAAPRAVVGPWRDGAQEAASPRTGKLVQLPSWACRAGRPESPHGVCTTTKCPP